MLFSNRRREMEESGVDACVRKRPRKKGKWTKRGSPEGGRQAVLGGWASRAVWAAGSGPRLQSSVLRWLLDWAKGCPEGW